MRQSIRIAALGISELYTFTAISGDLILGDEGSWIGLGVDHRDPHQ
jgi:hypothetical protein